jgi:hypothetical protein
LWYYREVTRLLRQAWPDALVEELARTLAELEQLVADAAAKPPPKKDA